jgi:putative peptidoglycan lipid II flippase
VLLSGFLPAFLATLSHSFHAGEADEIRPWMGRCLAFAFGAGAVAALAAAALFLVLSPRRLGMGQMTPEAVSQTLQATACLYLGLAPYAVMILLARVHIALMNYSAVFVGSAANLVLNAILDAVLAPRFGVNGVALSSSLTYALIALLLGYLLFRRKEWRVCAA